jgi:hypothetical protein
MDEEYFNKFIEQLRIGAEKIKKSGPIHIEDPVTGAIIVVTYEDAIEQINTILMFKDGDGTKH